MCQICHIALDRTVLYRGEHVLPFYKCPECRTSTFVPWDARPVNVELERLCCTHEDYAKRLQECTEISKEAHKNGTTISNRHIDLAAASQTKRAAMATALYNELLPRLAEAAMKGKSYVLVDDPRTVADIEVALDYLAAFLFTNNNIYQVTVNPAYREAQILFTKEGPRQKTYTNSTYTPPPLPRRSYDSAREQGPPPPSPTMSPPRT